MQNILQNPDVRKYTNRATEGGVKLLTKTVAMFTWGVITFVRDMFKMVLGK